MQQHIPTTKNLSLEIAGGRPPVDESERKAVGALMADLAKDLSGRRRVA